MLEEGLKKTKISENIIVYRGVGDDFISNILNDEISEKIANLYYNNRYYDKPIPGIELKTIQKEILGKTYIDEGFTSTSYIKEKAFDRMIMLKINVPKSTQAATVDKISKLREIEKEILINKRYKYKINKIYFDKKWIIVADLIL